MEKKFVFCVFFVLLCMLAACSKSTSAVFLAQHTPCLIHFGAKFEQKGCVLPVFGELVFEKNESRVRFLLPLGQLLGQCRLGERGLECWGSSKKVLRSLGKCCFSLGAHIDETLGVRTFVLGSPWKISQTKQYGYHCIYEGRDFSCTLSFEKVERL